MSKHFIALDFSCSKPAMTTLINGCIDFFVFPSNIDTKSESILKAANIIVHNRNLEPINKANHTEHTLIIEQVNRASNLAYIIASTINDIVSVNNISKDDTIIANEGFSFGSKGDAALDLAGYKYLLMFYLIKRGFTNFRTYSPIQIKKTAHCSFKGSTKLDMIKAMANDNIFYHPFIDLLALEPQQLKKKTAFVPTIDDIADSYWCLRTCLKETLKENTDK